MLLLLNAGCIVEKQQIPILVFGLTQEGLNPQFTPNGRWIIVISNDITYKIGSFGPQEDILFKVR
jgi:hypothetical protein